MWLPSQILCTFGKGAQGATRLEVRGFLRPNVRTCRVSLPTLLEFPGADGFFKAVKSRLGHDPRCVSQAEEANSRIVFSPTGTGL